MSEENKETKEKTMAQEEEALVLEGYSDEEIKEIKVVAKGRGETLSETAESDFVKQGIEGMRLEKSGTELETILPFDEFKKGVIAQNEIEGGASVQETPKKYPSFESWRAKRLKKK
ncbi:MAG: hypothetical protein KJI70_00720 [Patescibacteria group bacterium]|nr:hypothetical protein [Patescibacteria group bacterium]